MAIDARALERRLDEDLERLGDRPRVDDDADPAARTDQPPKDTA